MKNYIGKAIKVDRDGPESRVGKLLHVGEDYIVILTDDEVVYYNSHHIKNFTESATGNMNINTEVPEDLELKEAHSFKGLFKCSKYSWIKINRGGPNTVEGLLAGLEDNFVVLVNCEEIIRVTLYHINNISYGRTKSEQDESNDESNYESGYESSDESSSSSSSN
ncbi:hypothetical protein [Neobacillus cucumis]|nr:hypothetical protein [Neobacillus cucumis]MBM7656311.1 spore coat protein B [Neobacillus cucumis]